MLKPKNAKSFKKNLKKFEHQKAVLEDIYDVIEKLINEEPLEEKHRDHPLIGNWIGHRECHVRNDILLIYKIIPEEGLIIFERIGNHSELF